MADKASLVERVARALAAARGKTDDWREFRDEARAAIAAMRVPSQRMLEAAGAGLVDYSDIRHDWRVMVDAALAEATNGNGNNGLREQAGSLFQRTLAAHGRCALR